MRQSQSCSLFVETFVALFLSHINFHVLLIQATISAGKTLSASESNIFTAHEMVVFWT